MKSAVRFCGVLLLLAAFAPVAQAATVTKTFHVQIESATGLDTQGLDGGIVKVRVMFTDGGAIAGTQVFLTGSNPNTLVGTIGAKAGTIWAVQNNLAPGAKDRLKIGLGGGSNYTVNSQTLALTLNSPSAGVVAANTSLTPALTNLIKSVIATPFTATSSVTLILFDTVGGPGSTTVYGGTVVGVPEPASMAVLGLVMAGGVAAQRRRNRRIVVA